VLGAAVLLPGFLSACSKPLSEPECYELLDQYVHLLFKSDNPEAPAQHQAKAKGEARAKAKRDPAFSECSSRVSRSQFECAMDANDPNQLEQCLL
jgi:hypothetical protein